MIGCAPWQDARRSEQYATRDHQRVVATREIETRRSMKKWLPTDRRSCSRSVIDASS